MLIFARLSLLILFLAFWEISALTYADEFFISRPTVVFDKFVGLVTSGRLAAHAWITVIEVFAGFGLGALIGVGVGLLLGRNETLAKVFDPFLTAIYSLPKIALAPLFILWFGIDMGMKIALTATIVFFLVFLNTYTGVRSVSKEQVQILRLMGAKEKHLLTKVVLPSAIIWVFAGLRLSVPYALIGAIVGEMMAANRGLGYLLQDAAGQLDTGGVFAALIAIIILALLLQTIVKWLETYLTPWNRANARREAAL